MRRLTYALIITIAAVGADRLAAQDKPTMTFTGAPTTNVKVWNGTTMVSVGTTDVSGALSSYDTSKLAGKPEIDIRFDQCLSSNQNLIDLFPAVPASQTEENKCPPGCTCTRKNGAGTWGNSFTAQTPFGPAGATPGQSFYTNPRFYLPVGGGAAIAAVILATRGSSTTTGGTTGTVTFQNTLGSYNVTAVSNGGCTFPLNATGTAVIGGTMAGTTIVITEGPSAFSYSGSTIAGSATNTFDVSGTGSGTVPTGTTGAGTAGTYTGNVSGQTNGTTFSATETLSNPACGTVSVTVTGSKG